MLVAGRAGEEVQVDYLSFLCVQNVHPPLPQNYHLPSFFLARATVGSNCVTYLNLSLCQEPSALVTLGADKVGPVQVVQPHLVPGIVRCLSLE